MIIMLKLFVDHRFKLIGTLFINGLLIASSVVVCAVIISVYNLETLQVVGHVRP